MTNAELIKALRNCASPDMACKGLCPYHGVEYCLSKKDLDAADALEAAEKRIVNLLTALYLANEKLAYVDCQPYTEIDGEEMIDDWVKTLVYEELHTQILKEVGWITADNPPKNEGLYLVGLSVGWDNEYVVRLARYTKDLSEALFSSKLSGDGWYRWDGDNDCDVICHPKYWMELPKPPAARG